MLTAIAAIGPRAELGGDKRLLYRSSADMAFFSGFTQGKPVIMGKTTFLECGVLKNRHNVVLSSTLQSGHGYDVFRDLHSLLQAHSTGVVIGGASVYAQFAPYVSELFLSVWNIPPERTADTFFPLGAFSHLDHSELVMKPRGERFTIVRYYKQ